MTPNPLLNAWINEYESIAEEFVEAIVAQGCAFGERDAWRKETDALVDEARKKGALMRNAQASITSGPISEACIACSSSLGSRTFTFSLKCHRNCYFCFNPNEERYEERMVEDVDWRSDFDALVAEGRDMTHIALTGGEPLLNPAETVDFFMRARANWPKAHLRLYTTGDQLDQDMLEALVEAGMNEIRFSVKPDDGPELRKRTIEHLRMASAYAAQLREDAVRAGRRLKGRSNTSPQHRKRAFDVMVEMPVLPGDFETMRELLDELDAMGAFGINLLEFCYPFNNWPEFERRGFKLKNPPYEVAYNYEYAGSLAVEGSEQTCLELVRYALDNRLGLGVHYCSLANKHRSQVHMQNHSFALVNPCYKLDSEDFFYKTVRVFGADVKPVAAFLERTQKKAARKAAALSWSYDAQDDCLQFHPRHLAPLQKAGLRNGQGIPVSYALSYNILENQQGGVVIRELKLEAL